MGDVLPTAATFLLAGTFLVLATVIELRYRRRRRAGEPAEELLTDPVTGAAGHRAFQDRLAHECDRAFRFGDSFAVALIDIDDFQAINNRHGHSAGDAILHEAARRLQGAVREIDLFARFGGDQFGLVLPHTLVAGGVDVAERLRQIIAGDAFTASAYLCEDRNGERIALTVSAGLAYYPDDGTSPPDLVAGAQEAVRFAKSLGGNQVQLHSELPASPKAEIPVLSEGAECGTVVRSLAAAVDIRDRYTHSHSRVVSQLAAATARELNLEGQEVGRIRVGALLHDVGKIGVPDAILSKEGPLSPHDWATIHRHPALGKTIIEKIPELHSVIPLVLHHQERWDGDGYPAGLSASSIPLGARIIAVADAYHAIRSERPYRSGRSHRDAVSELFRCSGQQFDPSVVTALTSVLEREPRLQTATDESDAEREPYTGPRSRSSGAGRTGRPEDRVVALTRNTAGQRRGSAAK